VKGNSKIAAETGEGFVIIRVGTGLLNLQRNGAVESTAVNIGVLQLPGEQLAQGAFPGPGRAVDGNNQLPLHKYRDKTS
jgi:hypothetical protein